MRVVTPSDLPKAMLEHCDSTLVKPKPLANADDCSM